MVRVRNSADTRYQCRRKREKRYTRPEIDSKNHQYPFYCAIRLIQLYYLQGFKQKKNAKSWNVLLRTYCYLFWTCKKELCLFVGNSHLLVLTEFPRIKPIKTWT